MFRSNALRVCPIWDGGVQKYNLLIGENQDKRAVVAYHHFVTWEYCVFFLVSFCITLTRMHAMLNYHFVSRVGCILVLTNMMVIVGPPGDKYNYALTLSFKCQTNVPWFGYG